MELDNMTLTENGAAAFESTSDKNLDLFFFVNAMRNEEDAALHTIFNGAFKENPLDAMKILFWSRDIRGGQGERRAFRVLINWLAKRHPGVMRKNLHLISEYGRWDDIFSVFGTSLEEDALALIRKSLKDGDGLCAKWMPREKSAKRDLAIKIREYLGMSPKGYRKLLAGLTKVVETQMCAQEWTQINYEHVPSMAMKNYRKAFRIHDESGFDKFLTAVEAGEKKINSGTLYPYDIVRNILKHASWYGSGGINISKSDARSLQAQWDNLPNYMKGNSFRVLPVADVSGSMSGTPMEVCIAMSLYIAERNEGVFQNAFITFSGNPQLQYITGNDLIDRVNQLRTASWGGNTDLYKTFKLVLNRAIKHNVPEDEMPELIIIFSDMQFDGCVKGGNDKTMFKVIRDEYEAAGYNMPRIAFWNLRSVTSNVPVEMNENGVALVSGFSPSTVKQLLSTGDFNPLYVMRQVIDADRYKAVAV